jgi:ArsR family transcriptional regulator
MGITKSEHFSKEITTRAALLKALGHPARLAIIEKLLEVETCIGGDLVEHLPLAQATVSQHLKELKSVGVIQGTISGTAICYCLNREVIKDLRNYFKDTTKAIKKNKCK